MSCAPKCSDEDIKILNAAENGNLEVVKDYLENGGDPLLNCSQNGGKGNLTSALSSDSDLYFAICMSESLPLIEYYLSKDIPDNVKNKMFYYYSDAEDKNNRILISLINNNARILEYVDSCIYSENTLNKYKKIEALNYDFNWIDPEDGNNILMKYAKCSATENETELLAMIKYFVQIGVPTDVKNKEGKTASEIAVNEGIKSYLNSLK